MINKMYIEMVPWQGFDFGDPIAEMFARIVAFLRIVFTLVKTQLSRLILSSEYFDAELGLIYYNYRHYNPTSGRFLSRDPIAESGGFNLYATCRNNVVMSYDVNGLFGDGRAAENKPKERYEREHVYIGGDLFSGGAIFGYQTIDHGPSGHSDFEGFSRDYTKGFDYTLEDHGLWVVGSGPYGFGITNHFQNIGESEEQVTMAISFCNRDAFQRAMHRYQDYWAHYKKGFRTTGGEGVVGHTTAGSAPDDDEEAWKLANEATKLKVAIWNKTCCLNKEKQWVRRDGFVFSSTILNDDLDRSAPTTVR